MASVNSTSGITPPERGELGARGTFRAVQPQCRDNPEPRFHDVEEFSR